MVKAKPIEDLNVPANINTVEKRLGYFLRRIKLSTDAHNANIGNLPEDWLETHLGLSVQLAHAKTEAADLHDGNGLSDLDIKSSVHYDKNAVVWPNDVKVAASETKLHFLLNLKKKATAAGKTTDEMDSLNASISVEKEACSLDGGWDQ